MAASRLEPPRFMEDTSGYPEYKRKLLRWARITKIAPEKQAEYVVYHLEDHPSGIQEKIDTAIGTDIENAADGMVRLVAFLDGIYAEDEMSEAWNKYKDFIRLRRQSDQPVNEFVAEFDKKHKRARESGCQFSDMVLGFNLLESCQLSETDEKFILIDVDFKAGKEQQNLLEQIKKSLKKFQGRDRLSNDKDSVQIKSEDVFVSSVQKEALLAGGWTPPGSAFVKKNSSEYRGRKNPLDTSGNPLQCYKCQSEYHLSDRCDSVLDSREKSKKKKKKKSKTDAAALTVLPQDNGGTSLSKILAQATLTEYNMVCVNYDDSAVVVENQDSMRLSDLLAKVGVSQCGESESKGDVSDCVSYCACGGSGSCCAAGLPMLTEVSESSNSEVVHGVNEACADRDGGLSTGHEVSESSDLQVIHDTVEAVSGCDGGLLVLDDVSDVSEGQVDHVFSPPSCGTDLVLVSGEEQELCLLIEEAGCRGVLDTACSRSVAGFGWVQRYTNAVSPAFAQSLNVLPSSRVYQFGGGEKRQSYGTVSLPIVIGEIKVSLTIEMVHAQIPLLIGSNSMKLGKAVLNFNDYTAIFFGEIVDMAEVGSGHFCIDLLTPHVETHVNNVKERDNFVLQVLVGTDKINLKLLRRLHHYYGHTPPDRLLKLLHNAGRDTKDLKKPLMEIEKTCEACVRTKKRSPKPKSSVPRVDSANVVVTLDLKEWCFKKSKKYICYMIDMYSRLTMGNFLKDKNPSSVVECIMSTWVPAFGLMKGIHSDIGGEFSNAILEEVASHLGVTVTTTASYSPHQNGLNERNHAVVDIMITRMLLSEPTLKPQMALLWALNAKNSLENCYGFTPFQLHIGRTPMMPSATRDGPPSFEDVTKSENFAAHLNALHAARREFVRAESSQSLKLAMKSKVHPRGDDVASGDEIYYKQKTLRKEGAVWSGPAKVVATNGKKLFVDKGARLGTVNRDDSVRKGEELWKFADLKAVQKKTPATESLNCPPQQSLQGRGLQHKQKASVLPSASDSSDDEDNNVSVGRPAASDIGVDELVGGLDVDLEIPSASSSSDEADLTVMPGDDSLVDGAGNMSDSDVRQSESDLSHGDDCSEDDTSTLDFHTANESDESEVQLSDHDQVRDSGVIDDLVDGENVVVCSAQDIRKDDVILYVIPETGVAETAFVLGRAAKASGPNRFWWNVQVKDSNCQKSVNLEALRELRRVIPAIDTITALVVSIPRNLHHDPECIAAKEQELQNWDQFGVFKEVPDEGQARINTSWVLVRKGSGLVKARLCIRGDQEPNKEAIRTDSPTVNKVNIKLFFVIAVHKGWQIKTADIKAAFLQGSDLDRDVFVRPPVERRKEGIIWKMLKRAYGFVDASRGFYLELKKVLVELGCVVCQLDPALFLYFGEHSSLQGLLASHVDDLMHGAGTSEFNDLVLAPLKRRFTFGSEDQDDFKYIGMHVRQVDKSIVCDQDVYVENMEIPYIDSGKALDELLDEDGQCDFRSAVGRIGWVSSSSRPDLAFNHLLLSTLIGQATVRDMKLAVKTVKQIKCDNTVMKFVPLGPVDEWVLEGYGDAGHKSLPDKLSSACGYVLILRNKVTNTASVLSWKSTKIRRVVGSSTAAEALATVESSDALMYISAVLRELLGDELHIPLHLFTDCKNLHNAVHTSALVDDQRMRLDIARLKESVERGEVSQLHLTTSENMLADVLTKKGASGVGLLNILRNGCCS